MDKADHGLIGKPAKPLAPDAGVWGSDSLLGYFTSLRRENCLRGEVRSTRHSVKVEATGSNPVGGAL